MIKSSKSPEELLFLMLHSYHQYIFLQYTLRYLGMMVLQFW